MPWISDKCRQGNMHAISQYRPVGALGAKVMNESRIWMCLGELAQSQFHDIEAYASRSRLELTLELEKNNTNIHMRFWESDRMLSTSRMPLRFQRYSQLYVPQDVTLLVPAFD